MEVMQFEEDFSNEIYSHYTGFLYRVVWDCLPQLHKYFPLLPSKGCKLINFKCSAHHGANEIYIFTFSDGETHQSPFSLKAFIESIYKDPEVIYVPTEWYLH